MRLANDEHGASAVHHAVTDRDVEEADDEGNPAIDDLSHDESEGSDSSDDALTRPTYLTYGAGLMTRSRGVRLIRVAWTALATTKATVSKLPMRLC